MWHVYGKKSIKPLKVEKKILMQQCHFKLGQFLPLI